MFRQISLFAAFAVILAMGALVLDRQSRTGADGEAPMAAPARGGAEGGRHVVAITADRSGHFSVATLVNGVHIEMLADTGATRVALSEADARRAGLDIASLSYTVPVRTANGTAMAAHVVLGEVAVGGIVLRDVKAMVAPAGTLDFSLLGMSFIGKVDRFELRGDQLILSN